MTVTNDTAMFQGGPLDGMTLRLPAGSWRGVLWGDATGGVGGSYVRWAMMHAGFGLLDPATFHDGMTHYYKWEAAA